MKLIEEMKRDGLIAERKRQQKELKRLQDIQKIQDNYLPLLLEKTNQIAEIMKSKISAKQKVAKLEKVRQLTQEYEKANKMDVLELIDQIADAEWAIKRISREIESITATINLIKSKPLKTNYDLTLI